MDRYKYRKQDSQWNWTDCEYHVQDIRHVSHTTVKIPCATTQFTLLKFCGMPVKTNGVWGTRKNYHLIFDHKVGYGKCAIQPITFSCAACNQMLNIPWYPGVYPTQQPHYQSVVCFTYWYVLGFFNSWNIIKFTNITTSSEDCDEVLKIYLME